MTNPHRGPCGWNEDTNLQRLGWFQLVDYAVYHAPGWKLWQSFRRSLIGQPMPRRVRRLEKWMDEAREADDPTALLVDLVRVVNLLRSLRGRWKEEPALREMHDRLHPELTVMWKAGEPRPWRASQQGRPPR